MIIIIVIIIIIKFNQPRKVSLVIISLFTLQHWSTFFVKLRWEKKRRFFKIIKKIHVDNN